MTEGRKSLVGMFAIALLLTFFAKKPISLSWSGVEVQESHIWLCLLISHLYFIFMAYTKGAFKNVNLGGTLRQYLAVTEHRAHRIGEVANVYGARFFASGALILITIGLLRSYFCP